MFFKPFEDPLSPVQDSNPWNPLAEEECIVRGQTKPKKRSCQWLYYRLVPRMMGMLLKKTVRELYETLNFEQ